MVYEFPPEAVLRLNGYVSRGVKAAEIDENGHLLLTLTDGTVADLGSAVGPQGERGFTFTPSVDDSGNVSWTNNGGLENPATKNIRGPRGFRFTPEVSDDGELSWTNDGGLQNPATKNIRGPRGFRFTPSVNDDGELSWTNDGGLQNPEAKNIRGPRGFTFTPSVNDSGELSWTNDGGLENPATKNIRGPQGSTGAPGYSPTVQISKTGKVTTVTITDENGDHVFKINDGQDGTGSGDMHTSTYDPQGKAQDIFAYADAQAGAAMDAATDAASAASRAQSAASSAQSTASSAQSAASRAQSAASSAQTAATRAQDTADAKLAKSGDGSDVTSGISITSVRRNLVAGEKLSVMFGKIYKYFADLGSLAFKSTVAKSDLAEDVQTSLGKADTAMQSYTETDPTVPGWAKAEKKPTYTASEVGAVPTSRKVNGKALSADIELGAVYTATLTAAGWATSGAWKTQTVSVTGLKASYNAAPFVDVALSGTDAAADAELAAAWLGISESAIANTAANSLTVKFPATVDTPTVNIPIRITVYD